MNFIDHILWAGTHFCQNLGHKLQWRVIYLTLKFEWQMANVSKMRKRANLFCFLNIMNFNSNTANLFLKNIVLINICETHLIS